MTYDFTKARSSINRADSAAFQTIYGWLLHDLLNAPIELNVRTGTRVAVIPGGVSFSLDLSDRLVPTCGLRKTFPRVAAAEIAWYISGEQDATWMTQQAPIWDKFVEPLKRLRLDALGHPYSETFQGVKAAYGYRWRNHFERDQLREAIDALKRNPSDRRIVISAWDPSEDGLMSEGQKNVPCPAMFTLNVLDGRLHSTMLLRSSDVFVGLPYDVLGHALLMDAIATELEVGLGIMHFTLAHAHLYEVHWALAQECLRQTPVAPALSMPAWSVSEIEVARDEYVATVARHARRVEWPKYNPRPEVVA